MAGSSYGGGLSLLIAAADHRVGAVAADITWNDLSHALFPNFAGTGPGVFKKLWAGYLFGNAFPASASELLARASATGGGRAGDPPTGRRAAGASPPTSARPTRPRPRPARRTRRCGG